MSVYPLLSSQIELPAFKYARGVGGVKSFFTLHGLQEYDVKARLAYKLSSKEGTVLEETKISETAVAGDRALIKCTFFPTRMWDIWYLNVEPTDRSVPEVFGKNMRVIECLVRFESEEGMTSIGASLEDTANLSPGRGVDSETNDGISALASGGASLLTNKDKKFSCMDDPPGETKDVENVDTASGTNATEPFFDEKSSGETGRHDNSQEPYMNDNMESKAEEAKNFEYFEVERTQDSVSSVHEPSRQNLYRDALECLKVAKDVTEKLEELIKQAKNLADHD